jgi:hypothetical protein
MSTEHLVPKDLRSLYHVKEGRRRRARDGLSDRMVAGGGNRSAISRRIDDALYARSWQEKAFSTSILVDQNRIDSPTHAVDCFNGGVPLEMEWNNKDPVFRS